jgi:hypothetical protein
MFSLSLLGDYFQRRMFPSSVFRNGPRPQLPASNNSSPRLFHHSSRTNSQNNSTVTQSQSVILRARVYSQSLRLGAKPIEGNEYSSYLQLNPFGHGPNVK